MKNIICTALLATAFALGFSACHSTKSQVKAVEPAIKVEKGTVQQKQSPATSMIPKAVIYKTNGDFNDHVFINIGPDETIISYPAPSDVSTNSEPVKLQDGWLLDRRGGIGENSVFLKYTYQEYSQLSEAPSRDQLLEAIIPGAKVTRVKVLPISVNQAAADPQALNQYIE